MLCCSDDYPILAFPRQLWVGPGNYSAAPARVCRCFPAESARRWGASLLRAEYLRLVACPYVADRYLADRYLDDGYLAALRLVELGFRLTADDRPYSDGSSRHC